MARVAMNCVAITYLRVISLQHVLMSLSLFTSLLFMQEAIRLGIVPKIDYAAAPITFDMRTFPIFAGEVKNPTQVLFSVSFHSASLRRN
jgi:hypothetical protein